MITLKTKRKQKVDWLRYSIETVIKKKKTVDVNKLLAEFSLALDTTARTGKEILQAFKDSGKITLGKIKYNNVGQILYSEIVDCNFK